jgi:hypothetical protein
MSKKISSSNNKNITCTDFSLMIKNNIVILQVVFTYLFDLLPFNYLIFQTNIFNFCLSKFLYEEAVIFLCSISFIYVDFFCIDFV